MNIKGGEATVIQKGAVKVLVSKYKATVERKCSAAILIQEAVTQHVVVPDKALVNAAHLMLN